MNEGQSKYLPTPTQQQIIKVVETSQKDVYFPITFQGKTGGSVHALPERLMEQPEFKELFCVTCMDTFISRFPVSSQF